MEDGISDTIRKFLNPAGNCRPVLPIIMRKCSADMELDLTARSWETERSGSESFRFGQSVPGHRDGLRLVFGGVTISDFPGGNGTAGQGGLYQKLFK